VPPATLDELQLYAERTAPSHHDEFSRQALARAIGEYAPRRRERVAPFRLTVDGRPYDTVHRALADPAASFNNVELKLVDPPTDPRVWEWLVPFDRIVFSPDGSAEIFALGSAGTSRRAMARLLLREHYVPRARSEVESTGSSSATDELRMQLDPLHAAVQFARERGVIPFAIALLLYQSGERARFELDLVDEVLLRDPRAGRLAITRRVHRSSRVSNAVDRYLARGDLPMTSARALELLVETHGLTPLELGHIQGGVRELGGSALQGLVARGLATYDKRTGIYRPRFDAFLTPSGGEELGDGAVAPLPNPALRTSVMELLAAADSRATCPLCGDTLPPGLKTILCARCQTEVGNSAAE
jgi:hypothetical protein